MKKVFLQKAMIIEAKAGLIIVCLLQIIGKVNIAQLMKYVESVQRFDILMISSETNDN